MDRALAGGLTTALCLCEGSSSWPLSDWLPVTLITAAQAGARHAGYLDPILSGAPTPSSPDMFSGARLKTWTSQQPFKKVLCENLEGGTHSHVQKCVVVGTAANTSISSYLPVHFKNEEMFRAASGLACCGDRRRQNQRQAASSPGSAVRQREWQRKKLHSGRAAIIRDQS